MLRRCLLRLGGVETGINNRGWNQQSENFDPRVVYSDEPWANPLKQTTGMAGLPVEHRWRKKLLALYTHILEDLKMIPEDNTYRLVVESIFREFLRIVSNVGDTDWMIVERKIGLGQVEQLIIMAMDERELVQAYCEWKLWLIPVETLREIQDEMRSDMYFNYAGPPEPYLSDDELKDIVKIDQQRMAEEQKHISMDLKKLAGKTSRMMLDDADARQKKRAEYKAAVDEYIRETKLNKAFHIASDGEVSGTNEGFQSGSPSATSYVMTDTSSYDTDPARKHAAITDFKESQYWPSGGQSQDGFPMETTGALPTRLAKWSAVREGAVTYVPASDSPHVAPVSKGSHQGRKIGKWVKPAHSLKVTSEAPPQKEN